MHSLGVIECHPLPIAESLGIETVAHVRVSLFGGCGSGVYLSSVHLFELSHEILGEVLSSGVAGEDEADQKALEGDEGSSKEHVTIVGGESEDH